MLAAYRKDKEFDQENFTGEKIKEYIKESSRISNFIIKNTRTDDKSSVWMPSKFKLMGIV